MVLVVDPLGGRFVPWALTAGVESRTSVQYFQSKVTDLDSENSVCIRKVKKISERILVA